MTDILFFASLKEELGCDQLSYTLPKDQINVAQLKQLLIEQEPGWQKALSNPLILAAINHDMVTDEALIKEGDEVAFFPPVTGG